MRRYNSHSKHNLSIYYTIPHDDKTKLSHEHVKSAVEGLNCSSNETRQTAIAFPAPSAIGKSETNAQSVTFSWSAPQQTETSGTPIGYRVYNWNKSQSWSVSQDKWIPNAEWDKSRDVLSATNFNDLISEQHDEYIYYVASVYDKGQTPVDDALKITVN